MIIIYPNILSGVCAFNCHSVASKCRNIIVKMMLPTGQCVAATVEEDTITIKLGQGTLLIFILPGEQETLLVSRILLSSCS